ncbi:MAG: hypothetical protein ACYDBJ_08280 [Aggregatilineales bacterium]
MANWQIAVLIGGVVGLIVGWWVARKSVQKEALTGGPLGTVLHYLACAAQTAAAPAALVGVILSHDLHLIPRILTGVGLAFSFIAVALILLVAHATYETVSETSSQPKPTAGK